MNHSWRSIGLVIIVMLGLVVPASGRVSAQGTETETSVTGNSYTSPTYGYSLSWDALWEVSEERSESGYDLLNLTNGVSNVYFEGFASQATESACLAGAEELAKGIEGVGEFVQATREDGSPLEGESPWGTWAVFDFIFTDSQGAETALSEFISCKSIVPGESILQITQIVESAAYNDEIDPFAALVNSIVLPDDSTGPNETPEPEVTEVSGEPSALQNFIELATEDADGFWTREFPILSGGQEYVEPQDYVAFDDEVRTPCDRADEEPSRAGKIGEGSGPFYCFADQVVYLDLLFAEDQVEKYGPFPLAEAIAHEIGHHVQNRLGIEVCAMSPCLDPSQVTSQELEVMADCFAGAWARDMESRGRLGSFDIEANLVQYAVAFGDPYSGPGDPGAHGRGALRIFWFLSGYYYGSTICLTASPATTPSTDGPAPTAETEEDEPTEEPEFTPEPTEPPVSPTEEPQAPTEAAQSPITVQLAESAQVGEMTMAATETDRGVEIGALQAGGEWLIVYILVRNDGAAAAPFDYANWELVDSTGRSYPPAPAATDELVSTVVENGIDEELVPGELYDLAIAFDVPTSASGFSLVTSDGLVVIELDQ